MRNRVSGSVFVQTSDFQVWFIDIKREMVVNDEVWLKYCK